MRQFRHTALAVLLATSTVVSAFADGLEPPNSVGRMIDNFKLKDYLGAAHKLSEWAKKRAVVVVFVGTECPVARLAGSRLAELADDYAQQDVAFVGIDSNQQDSLAEIAHYAKQSGIDFPILKDPGNKVADLFGAQRTPEAFVLDANRVVRYQGLIDDQYGVGYARAAPTQEYLALALEAILAGKEVGKPFVQPVGCHIGRVQRGEPRGDITYAKEIAPLIHKHCAECHRTGEVAPFSLTSYDEVAPWAETIRDVLTDCRMPPWHANPQYGHFLNDARLPDGDKELILTWVKNGCPRGDLAHSAALPEFAEGWHISEPDAVYRMREPFSVPASGVIPYQYFTLDVDFPEDRWVRAAEIRPGNRTITHHLVVFFHSSRDSTVDPREPLFNMVATFLPGGLPLVFVDGVCRRIPAGSKLMIQAHYTPCGSPQTDQSEVGFVFAEPAAVKREVTVSAAFNAQFSIPPGANDYAVAAAYEITQDSLLYYLSPHMHTRGKSFEFRAVYPNGHREILLDVAHYDFNWQHSYVLAEPKRMPAGTRIYCTAKFDNSADNLANPDPNVAVAWGEQSWEEMMVGTMGIGDAEQDLSQGGPIVKELKDGWYEVLFAYRPKHDARHVFVTGSFNDWTRYQYQMQGPDAEGWYRLPIKLERGTYRYKFLVDGKGLADPGNPSQAGVRHDSLVRVGGKP